MDTIQTHKRLFVAIKVVPSSEFLQTIDFIKNNTQRDLINWIREDHYHITLKFLGKTPINKIDTIKDSIQKTISNFSSFILKIENTGIFGSKYKPNVLWFGMDNHQVLKSIKNQLDENIQSIKFKTDKQNFIPHLSLARLKKIEDLVFFQKVIEKVSHKKIQSLEVKEILLIESVLKSKGAEYHLLERFLLHP